MAKSEDGGSLYGIVVSKLENSLGFFLQLSLWRESDPKTLTPEQDKAHTPTNLDYPIEVGMVAFPVTRAEFGNFPLNTKVFFTSNKITQPSLVREPSRLD
jgi:hypothetical protein